MPSTTASRRASRRASLCVACTDGRPRRSTATHPRPTSTRKRSRARSCAAASTAGASCTEPLVTQTDPNRPAQWLRDLERQAVPRHSPRWQALARQGFARVSAAPRANIVVTHTATAGVRLPERVVYWAAGGCALRDAHHLRGAEHAYADYANMGVAARQTTRDGRHRLVFKLVAPCPYVARAHGRRDAQQWCRHLHFVGLERERPAAARWAVPTSNQNALFTLAVFPCTHLDAYAERYVCAPLSSRNAAPDSLFVTRKEFRAATRHGAGAALGVCAIDDPAYPPVQAHDLVLSSKLSETALQQALAAKRVSMHTPLVVYCANPSCAAAQTLMEKLTHIGFCNVWYFPEGMGR